VPAAAEGAFGFRRRYRLYDQEVTMKRLASAAIVLVSCGFTGCLVKDTSHTLYLSPDGSVVWSVLERDVRSAEEDGSKRWNEERQFLDGVVSGRHPIDLGLQALGAERTSVRLLRAERPYAVLTDARFARIDRVIQSFFDALRLDGRASLEWSGSRATLWVTLDIPEDESAAGDGHDTPIASLVDDLDRYRIVLTDGEFAAAEGFEILENGSQAKLTVAEGDAARRRIELRLTWPAR
jgi:hypothetical protein